MPSLNSERYIGDAIHSVLSQEVDDLELVIQDGGSTDGTMDVVRTFANSQISWRSEPDRGQADALNRAVRRAVGDWILWLNSDDTLAPGALSKLLPRLGSTRFLIVHGDFGIIDGEGRIVKRYVCSPMTFERLLPRGAYVFSATVFVNRGLVAEVGPFDERLHFCMDDDWLLRLAKASKAHYEPGIVAFLRDHAESKTRTHPWGLWRERWIVARRHGASRFSAGRGQVFLAAYLSMRPLLRSRLWRRLRPGKRLGGRLLSGTNGES
jgi:glycosyltransferase involved in cell wall biosynthesis